METVTTTRPNLILTAAPSLHAAALALFLATRFEGLSDLTADCLESLDIETRCAAVRIRVEDAVYDANKKRLVDYLGEQDEYRLIVLTTPRFWLVTEPDPSLIEGEADEYDPIDARDMYAV